MMLKAILAVDQMGSIGYKYDLPWPKNGYDLAWFHNHTLGCDVICGRKTWDGLHVDTKDRLGTAYVVSRDTTLKTGAYQDTVCDLETLKNHHIQKMRESDRTTWIIGGKEIYDQLIRLCDEIYLTRIPGVHRADTFMDTESILKDFSWMDEQHMPDGSSMAIYKTDKEF